MHQLTLEQFRISAETGGVLSVTIRASGAKFRIEAETRRGDATLITKREKSPREFGNPIKAFSLLRELGIREYRVDAKDWRPEEIALDRRTRPDRADALRATHDAYVRGRLEQALAAPQRTYTHAEVMQRADALIAAAETRDAR